MSFLVRTILLMVVSVCLLASHSIAAPVVMFDESHGQQFQVGKNGALDLSELVAFFGDNGYTVTSRADTLTKEALAAIDVLVLSGPFIPLSADEQATVLAFVEAGGGLLVTLHIAPPLRDLLYSLDVDFTNGTLRESQQVIDGNPLNFKVSKLANHPVTNDLDYFSVYGSWALRGTAQHVAILAESSARSWVDLDRDNQFSKSDAMQSFGVMVAGELGQGRYVVIGDDAVFQNRFFDQSNRKLARQTMGWVTSAQ
jgi:hypothetical protein